MDTTNLTEKQTIGRKSTTYYEDEVGNVVGKKCTKCGLPKLLSEFNRDKTKFAGRKSICRTCTRESDRGYYEVNREKKLEYKAWYYDIKIRKESDW